MMSAHICLLLNFYAFILYFIGGLDWERQIEIINCLGVVVGRCQSRRAEYFSAEPWLRGNNGDRRHGCRVAPVITPCYRWKSHNDLIIDKGKGKGSSLDIAPLTILDSSALQPRKWQLTGNDCIVPRRRQWQPIARANGLLGPQYAARRTTSQSAMLSVHPVIHVPNYMDHYSFTDPWGIDGWVGHVDWPIADGLTTEWSPIQLAVWRRIGKFRRPRPAF